MVSKSYALTHHNGIVRLTRIRGDYVTTSDLGFVTHRLDALESALIKSGTVLPADLDSFLKTSRASVAAFEPFETPSQQAERDPTTLSREETVDDTEGAARTLEHLAFGGSRVEGGQALPHFGARLVSTISNYAPNNDYHLTRLGTTGTGLSPDMNGKASGKPSGGQTKETPSDERDARLDALLDLIGPTDVFDMFWKKTDVAMRVVSRVLPSRERGEVLVRAVGQPC